VKKVITFIGLALLLSLCATPVYAIPVLPHAFYGSVFINGPAAPVGTTVEARGTGVRTGIEGNPIIVTEAGQYGGPGGLDPKLVVQGDIPSGATITFYVNGVEAEGQTATFEAGGGPTKHDLSVTIAAPPPPTGRGGGGGAPDYYIETELFGVEARFRISDDGEILETIEATSADGMLTITIPEGTIALDKDGDRLDSLTVDVDPSPPDPPEDCCIIGLAFDFGPDGATFAPPITFTWSYDPDALPEGVAEEDLVIAYYDEDAGEWMECECTCDPETCCVTACAYHFTTFAIIGAVTPLPPPPAPAAFSVSNLSVQPLEVESQETVTITVSVANTGGTEGSYTAVLKINGVKEAEKSVTITAGGSEIVTFSVTREEAGSYSVTVNGLSASFTIVAPAPPPPPPEVEALPAPAPPINWPLIGGIIAAVVVAALLIYFLVVRRRAY